MIAAPCRTKRAPNDAGIVRCCLSGSGRIPRWRRTLARRGLACWRGAPCGLAVQSRQDPDKVWIEVGKDRSKVRPEILGAEERPEAWIRIVGHAPGYGKYQEQTDREIPIVRLTREEGTGSRLRRLLSRPACPADRQQRRLERRRLSRESGLRQHMQFLGAKSPGSGVVWQRCALGELRAAALKDRRK